MAHEMQQDEHDVFVFGSNLRGIHRRGAALDALNKYGAVMGIGVGLQGRSYALPTKWTPYQTMPLSNIAVEVGHFLAFASANPDMTFFVTRVGCGLAGYTDTDIAPMFRGAPDNCVLPPGWREIADATE